MYRNVLTIAKVTICNIALAGLLTGCGTMVDLELDTPARGNEVVESKESKEEETEETKLYPLSRTFLKIEIPIFRHLILEDTPYSRHPQMPLTHDSGHFDYGTHYYSIWALPSPTLAGRQHTQGVRHH